MDNKKKSKKSSGTGILVIGLILILSAFSEFLENSEAASAVFAFLVIIVAAAVVLVKGKKKKGGKVGRATPVRERPVYSEQTHSHNRLNQTSVVRCTDGYEHWVNQLNGFLSAGLIDKAEYRVLLKKHPRESFDRIY